MGRFLHCDEPLDRFRRSSPSCLCSGGNSKILPARSPRFSFRNSQHILRSVLRELYTPRVSSCNRPMKFYHRQWMENENVSRIVVSVLSIVSSPFFFFPFPFSSLLSFPPMCTCDSDSQLSNRGTETRNSSKTPKLCPPTTAIIAGRAFSIQ